MDRNGMLPNAAATRSIQVRVLTACFQMGPQRKFLNRVATTCIES